MILADIIQPVAHHHNDVIEAVHAYRWWIWFIVVMIFVAAN